MGIADQLQESLGEKAIGHDRRLMRVVSSARAGDRFRKIAEAYDSGTLPLDVYVAAAGMQRANVMPEAPEDFVVAVEETIANVPSRTVSAAESYWRGKSVPKAPDPNSLFESLYLECGCGGHEEEDEDEEGGEEGDEEGDEEDDEQDRRPGPR